MFLVIGTKMDTNTPCCKGGYSTLDVARERLIELMHEEDGVDNYVIQEVNEGVDYAHPKTYILVSVQDDDKNKLEERLKEAEQDEAKMASVIDDVELELERFKQDWLQKKAEMNEMKQLLNRIEV
jgi:transcriptional regulator NrdR family protein